MKSIAITFELFVLLLALPYAAHSSQAISSHNEYKLIFPSSYDLPATAGGPGRDISRTSKFNNFVALLNDAGSKGFKLTSFVYDGTGLPVALVKRTEGNFEYKWLLTDARIGGSHVTIEFDQKYPELSQLGFRLADYSTFEDTCDYSGNSSEPGPLARECHAAYVFLFERERNVSRVAEHGHAGRHGSQSNFRNEIKAMLAKGLIPTHALPTYRFWFEPAGASDRRWGGADVEVVSEADDPRSWRPSTFKKRINELASRGYRAAMLDWDLALMYRPAGGSVGPFAYEWLKVDNSLEKDLARLQANGAVFLNTYEQENQLVFEHRPDDGARRYNYKTLRFEFQLAKDVTRRSVQVRLKPSSEHARRTIELSASEGFVVRDLFRSGKKVGAILERSL